MTMTGSAAASVVYEPDGLQTRFPVPFPVFDADDVHAVSVEGVKQTELANFMVEGLGTEEGVHVRFFAPPSFGPKLVLYRWTKRVQESEYPEGGRFPATVVETDFDRLVAMAQEVDEQLAWTLKIPRGAEVTPEEYTESIFLAADTARTAAHDAASSAAVSGAAAQDARNMAEEAAREAGHAALMAEVAAQNALEAATIVNQGMVDAGETGKGVVRLATLAEHQSGASGLAATPVHVKALHDSLRDALMEEIAAGDVRSFLGRIDLLPFRPTELPFGWRFCNGDRYALTSPQGAALNGFSENFKTDWGIVVSGSNISIPNMFYADGRGYFLRAVDGTTKAVGLARDDTMRPITGRLDTQTTLSGATGCFSLFGNNWRVATNIYGGQSIDLNSANLGANYDGVETAPVWRGMTPAIFLGV